MSRLSDIAARLEEWTHTKSGQWPTRSMDDDFNEAAAALRDAEQLLRDAEKWFGKFRKSPVLHDEGLPERIRALIG